MNDNIIDIAVIVTVTGLIGLVLWVVWATLHTRSVNRAHWKKVHHEPHDSETS